MKKSAGNKRLRVAHVSWGLEMGGQEKLLVELARHANRELVELRFVSLGSRGVLAEEIEAHGWPVRALHAPDRFRPGLILQLASFFRHERIDVVHTHEDRPLLHGAPAARVARAAAVIHTRHGQSLMLSRRQQALVRLASGCVDRFVCVSRDGERLTVEQGIRARKVATIWNGIDLERFPWTGGNPEGPAVCVARLSPEKDIATLIRAVRQVVRAEPRFRLEIAGDGVCRPILQQLVRDEQLDKSIHFHGQVRNVQPLLARARLFVLPSRSEGISLTILEAMAAGLPVAACRVGGNAEVVLDGETGLLTAPGNPAELAAALLRLVRDPVHAQTLGKAGRARVEQHFDIRRMVSRYEELYLDLLHGRRRSQFPASAGRTMSHTVGS